MLNVGCQPNDIVISHWQDASSTGTLRSACATDSPSMQNHLPDYSELHILPTAMRSLILTQQPIYQTPLTDTCSSRKAGLGVRTIARAVRTTKHTTKPITDKTSLLDKNWWHPLSVTLLCNLTRVHLSNPCSCVLTHEIKTWSDRWLWLRNPAYW